MQIINDDGYFFLSIMKAKNYASNAQVSLGVRSLENMQNEAYQYMALLTQQTVIKAIVCFDLVSPRCGLSGEIKLKKPVSFPKYIDSHCK